MSSYFHTYADPDASPREQMLRLVARAWQETLDAVAGGDRAAARAVLRGDRQRRRMVKAAHEQAARRFAADRNAHGRLVSASCAVHLIADTARIERLLVHLARQVVTGASLPEYLDADRVRLLASAGERRISRLAAGGLAERSPGR